VEAVSAIVVRGFSLSFGPARRRSPHGYRIRTRRCEDDGFVSHDACRFSSMIDTAVDKHALAGLLA
jgi:hypothetical protein